MDRAMKLTWLVILQALLGCASFETDRFQGAMPAGDLTLEELATPYRKHGGVI